MKYNQREIMGSDTYDDDDDGSMQISIWTFKNNCQNMFFPVG